MADQSISQLPVATTLTGDELTVVVQNGITKQTQVADIANAVAPGKFIDYLYFDTGSDLIVVYTDATTQNLGPIPGYIAASINSNGHLILTNSTGGTTDAGSVFATLSQTFITKNNESATLPNSQQLIAGSNIALAYGTNSVTISTSGASGSLNGAGTGIIVKDSSTTVVSRTLTSTAGISITNPDGIAGNPVISPSSKLANIQNLATTGILAVVGGTTVVDRNIVGTASQITVTGGDGSDNPTISIATNPVLPGTGSFVVPTGDTSQRPGALAGQLRFNTQLNVFEGQNNSGVWQTLALGGGVTSVLTGTGLTGGPITSTGTISISNTGVTAATYGSSTQVPQIAVNAQGQITSASNVTITPSSIGAISAVNGTANEITTSQVGTVVTVSLPSALTFTGKTVTGGTLTGVSISGATNTLTAIGNSSLVNSSVTIGSSNLALGGTLTTLAGVSISGSTNTLTNIPNSALTNSQITLGTTNIALGGTSLTPAGLTSVTVTQNPIDDYQLATKLYVDNRTAAGLDIHPSVVDDSDTNLASTYANGGTTPTWTTITGGNTIATGSAHGLSVNDVIVFGSTTNGITAGTAYFVESIVSSTAITISLNNDGSPITTLTNGTGLSITSRANSGVGATLTSTTNGPLVLEGYTAALNDRILVLGQTSAFQNGCYYVSQVGVALVSPWILTRTTDANKYIPNSAAGLDQGAYFLVAGGSDQGESYVCNTTGTIVFGTTNISFGQFGVVTPYAAGTGLTLTGQTFSISNTAVTAASYGSASQVGTFTVNAQGQLTLAGNTTISIPSSAINTAIPNSGLANSAITINGSSISLGGSVSVGTVTSVTSSTLTVAGTSAVPTINLTSGIVTPGTTGSSTQVPVVTVDTYGRVTNITTAAIGGGTVTSVSGTGTVSGITLSGTVTTSGSLTLGGSLNLSAPPAIGGTTPNAITGTTITATNYVGISGGTF